MGGQYEYGQNELLEMFIYDPETGYFAWRRRPLKPTGSGKLGYLVVGIRGTTYLVHRLIWMMMKGPIPHGHEVRHFNEIRDDNRLSNLFCVTKFRAAKGYKTSSSNTTSYCGIAYNRNVHRFLANSIAEKRFINLGYFETSEAAGAEAQKIYYANGLTERHGT